MGHTVEHEGDTMRVPPKPLGAYPWYIRPFFWNQRRTYGQVLMPGRLWGRAPLLFVAGRAWCDTSFLPDGSSFWGTLA